jgi:hypothetical protein
LVVELLLTFQSVRPERRAEDSSTVRIPGASRFGIKGEGVLEKIKVMKKRLLVVALNEFNKELLEEVAERYALPNIKRILDPPRGGNTCAGSC